MLHFEKNRRWLDLTRRERLKSALYLRLKKRKTFFLFEKRNFFFRKMSHSAEKCKKGDLFEFIHTFCCKISENSKGGPFGDKILESRTVPKIETGTL